MADVRSTLTTPTASDFFLGAAIPNNGTPIVVDRAAETAYILNASNAVVALSGGGGGGAPANATYLTLSTNGTLSDERVLTAGTNISFVDAGAGGTLTINASGGSSGLTQPQVMARTLGA